jgi:lipoate-protein ligase A
MYSPLKLLAKEGSMDNINKLSYIISDDTNPYHNIALEEYLLHNVEEQECILYLWQNRRTVVIGYNQNAWKECRTETLEADGGFLARRLSGGGAVFHDLGNLNFTFLVRKANYDVDKQSEVILRAVQQLGISAERSGRNDLTVDGRKFSGHAFYQTGDCCYHHGTIMIAADTEQMAKYLNVSGEKLKSKGVDSVRSRVGNLTDFKPDLTIEQMKAALLLAFGEVYGGESENKPELIPEERISQAKIAERQAHFGSWEWKYGRKIPFQYEINRRFAWGEMTIQLDVSEGVIRQAAVWSDGLDIEFPRKLERLLPGVRYQLVALANAVGDSDFSDNDKEMALQTVEALFVE